MTDTYDAEVYCVKCQVQRPLTAQIHEMNDRRIAKGTCPECGTTLTRIVGRARRRSQQ